MLDIEQSIVDAQSIIVDETTISHTDSWSVWKSLLTAPPLGSFGLYLLIALLLIGEIFYDSTNLWLSLGFQRFNTDEQHRLVIFYTYFVLTMVTLTLALVRAIFFFYHILNGSKYLHNRMLTGLLYTSMSFFESNPSGRILNRASNDQQVIDDLLPTTLFNAIQILLSTAGSIITISIMQPWTVLLLVPLTPTFWILRRYYMRTSGQLKCLESVARSPVYKLFGSSMNGLSTVRAFKVKDDFIQSFMNLVDAYARVYIITIGSARWFCLRLDLMTSLFSLLPDILAVMLRDTTNPSLVAFSLMYSINMTSWFQ